MSNYKPKGYWNKEKCHEEALKYSSRMEFSKKSGGAYNAAVRGNFIDEICEHIERRPPDYWNKQRCTEEALKYKTKTDFKKNSTSAFQSARRQKLLDEICRHMGLDYFERPRMIYSYEFLDNSVYIGLTYDPKARKSRHFCKNTSNRKSIVYKHLIDECSSYEYKELTGFLSEKEAQDKERYYIEEYRIQGWKILNTAKAGSIGGKLIKWTKDKCQIEALKYNGRYAFRQGAGGAFNAAYKNKWLDEICIHMNKKCA